ncbi:hypothetical protein NKH91_31855 [Mesorhizobium sp. M0894]|uniref:hypothetical protein n=1 Tax=unclassified Mesorhizobium TaxID=325217 RepID=UPI00333879FD
MQFHAVLDVAVVIGQNRAGRTATGVPLGHMSEVGGARRHALPDLVAVKVAAVGDDVEVLGAERLLGSFRHWRELCAVVADVVTSFVTIRRCSVSTATCTLQPTTPEPRPLVPSSGSRVGQEDLLVGRLPHQSIKRREPAHLLPQPADLSP